MDWFSILKKVREFCPKEESTFTVSDVLGAFKFKGTESTDPYHIASGWVGKLVRWNYVKRVGSGEKVGHKRVALYAVTPKGRQAENTSTREEELSNLDQLREAVRTFETARVGHQASIGKKTQKQAFDREEQAFVDLIALCNKLDREEFGVE